MAVAGCVSSAQVATTASADEPEMNCYEVDLVNATVQIPDYIPNRQIDGEAIRFWLDPAEDDECEDCDSSHNSITVDLWVVNEEGIEGRLENHMQALRQLAAIAPGMEFSAVREIELNGRTMYTYTTSHRYSFDDGRLMRGRYVLYALDNGQLYVSVTGIWEATRHEEMSAAFDTIAATFDVESAVIRPAHCPEEDEEGE
jgi:hypothetical protein